MVVLAGLWDLQRLAAGRPEFLGINHAVYVRAAEGVLAGEPLYAVHLPGRPAYGYRYPPVTVLAFLPYALLGRAASLPVHLGLQVLAGVALGRVLVAHAGRRRPLARIDRALLVAVPVAGVHAMPSLYYGNVNHLLALAVGAGLAWTLAGRERRAGVALGLAALVKVFPAAVGAWLLRVDARRAVLAATATGLGGLAASLALGVDTLRAYVGVLAGRARTAEAVGAVTDPGAGYATVRRPLALAGLDGPVLAVAAVAVLAPPVAVALARAETDRDRWVGAHAVVVGTVLAVPSYFVYLPVTYPTALVLAYRLRGPARAAHLLGVAVAAAMLTPARVLVALDRLPPALAGAVEPVAASVSLPTVGLALTLVACVVHARGDRPADDDAPGE